MFIKSLKKISGVILIVIGIIGLFLPIIPGVLLIFAGLLLLGVKKESIMKWFDKKTLKKSLFWKK